MSDEPSFPSISSETHSPKAIEAYVSTVDAFQKELDRRARAVAKARDHEIVLEDDVDQAESDMRVRIKSEADRFFRMIGPVLLSVCHRNLASSCRSSDRDIHLLRSDLDHWRRLHRVLALGIAFLYPLPSILSFPYRLMLVVGLVTTLYSVWRLFFAFALLTVTSPLSTSCRTDAFPRPRRPD